jgi:hypothetical protein
VSRETGLSARHLRRLNEWRNLVALSATEHAWGGKVHLDFDFRGRSEYVSRARSLVATLCDAELGAGTDTSNWVMAAQELLENLAKYAAPGYSSFHFELSQHTGRARARLATLNEAAPDRLAAATALLRRITESLEPIAVYDALVAESGEHGRSRLGLIRLRAEAGLDLAYAVKGTKLEIVVSGDVNPQGRST